MIDLDSDRYLFQNPLFKGTDGKWYKSFIDSVKCSDEALSIDVGAIFSILAFGFPCGDRTLCNEIKRKPWLSKIDSQGQIHLQDIPSHGRLWERPKVIAEKFEQLLIEEAVEVCKDRKNICILLSGGLDSRIVAGVLSKLYRDGRLNCKPLGVTWGFEDSRDVVYASKAAEILGFDWQHIQISPQTLIDNISPNIEILGCLTSPNHLHCMQWFKNMPGDTLVLGGSYGDSIGRAEFMGKHLLELDYLSPVNPFGLLTKDVLKSAHQCMNFDFESLRKRYHDNPKYVQCEHEMQGYYMRGMIGHVMSIISHYCDLYQMFTSPKVYGYIWSLHPSCRKDNVYAELLESLSSDLARLPWARTNKALRGSTCGRLKNLRDHFHSYAEWISGPVYRDYSSLLDPDWFEEIAIFDPDKIKKLNKQVGERDISLKLYGFRSYEIWLWLVSFRKFLVFLQSVGKKVVFENRIHGVSEGEDLAVAVDDRTKFRRAVAQSKFIRNNYRKIRRHYLFKNAIKSYPPEYN